MPLDSPDGYESGGNKDAQTSYERLIAVKGNFNDEETALINWLRQVYRNCVPLLDQREGQGPFVSGGSLVFNGGNIRLFRDGGRYYNLLKAKPGLTTAPRTGKLSGSSHKSDKDQFEIQLHGAGVFLVGICNDFPGVPGGAHTWLQSERHAASGNWGQWLGHSGDFLSHVKSGYMQVGAFGQSPYSEKDVEGGRMVSGRKANPLLCIQIPTYPILVARLRGG